MEDFISSLDRLSIPDVKSFDDDASTKVGNESDEYIDIERADRELRPFFEDKLRENAKLRSHCHSKVAVLLIDWVKKGEGYLETKSEVDRLQNLFKRKYNFTTRRRRLNTDLPQTVQKQMEKFLMDFTYELDTDETLLIIYYAGHGLPAGQGTLTLHGSTTKPESYKKQLNHIVWNQAEQSIKDTKGDKLLIFDCCYAGELARRPERGPALGKIFDFLGATEYNERALGPGDGSFTSALHWALDQLASDNEGFFLRDLRRKIMEAPNFQEHESQHHQTPCISDRGAEPTLRRLKIRPLPKDTEAPQRIRDDPAQHQPARPRFYLALELLFSTCPTTEEVAFLGKSIQDIVGTKGYPLQHVLWRGLSPKQKWKMKWKEAAIQALSHHRKEALSSPSSQSIQGTGSLFPVHILDPPATIVVPPGVRVRETGENSATSLSLPDESVCAKVADRVTGRQSYIHATMFIQKRSWFFLCLGMCIGFIIGYTLSEIHPLPLPYWPAGVDSFWSIVQRGYTLGDAQGNR